MSHVPLPPSRVLSLFAGIGGLDLGLELACGARAVAYVEADPFCAAVLASRMADGALGKGPVWSDVCTFDGRRWRGLVDAVIGGSPCQDLSLAGARAGLEGERSGLWKEQRRIVEESEPAWVWWENVGGAIKAAVPVVAGDLEALGFRVVGCTLRAADVGAPHKRERVFLLAYSERNALRLQSEREQQLAALGGNSVAVDARGDVADTDRDGCASVGESVQGRGHEGTPGHDADRRGGAGLRAHQWPPGRDDPRWATFDGPQPGVRREPARAATALECAPLRLHALGNSVVPQQAAAAFIVCWRRLFGG